jgi:F-type H+-transporting ATPase subunit delta
MARAQSVRAYAQAAFEVALAHEGLDHWEKDLADVQAVLANPDFAALLEAPQAPLEAKLRGVHTLLAHASPLVRNFTGVLIRKRQTRRFNSIYREFRRLADEHRGVARAEVVTAVPLDGERRQRVIDSLSEIVRKKVTVAETIDPAVLGGVVARIGDRLIDGSTRTRLRGLRATLAVRPSGT